MNNNKNNKSKSYRPKSKPNKPISNSNVSTSAPSYSNDQAAPTSSPSSATGYMHKFFNEQVRNFDWSLFQSSKPKSASSDQDSNNSIAKKDPLSYTLFFSPIRNDTKTTTNNNNNNNKWDHPFPADHSIKEVKRWLTSTKVFEDKIEELRKIGKHSFIVLSYFTPEFPALPYNASRLGWAQIYSSPGWKTSNFVFKFPPHSSSVEMTSFAEKMGTISSWRRFTGTTKNPLSNMACFYFSSVSPLLVTYLYTPRSKRLHRDIIITPTDSTKSYSCDKCKFKYHHSQSNCPFPDADGTIPPEFNKYFQASTTQNASDTPSTSITSDKAPVVNPLVLEWLEAEQVKNQELCDLLQSHDSLLMNAKASLRESESKVLKLEDQIKQLESNTKNLSDQAKTTTEDLVSKQQLIAQVDARDLVIKQLKINISALNSKYDNHVSDFKKQVDEYKSKTTEQISVLNSTSSKRISELESIIKKKDSEYSDVVDSNSDENNKLLQQVIAAKKENIHLSSINRKLQKVVDNNTIHFTDPKNQTTPTVTKNPDSGITSKKGHSNTSLGPHSTTPTVVPPSSTASSSVVGKTSLGIHSSRNLDSQVSMNNFITNNSNKLTLSTVSSSNAPQSTRSATENFDLLKAKINAHKKEYLPPSTPNSKPSSLAVTSSHHTTTTIPYKRKSTSSFHSPTSSPTKAYPNSTSNNNNSSSFLGSGIKPPDPSSH